MPTIMSPMRTIASLKSTTTPLFNAMTDWVDVTYINLVMFSIELAGVGNLECQPAAQFSADGITWDAPIAINLGIGSGNWTSAPNWTHMESYVAAPFGGAPRTMVRFGLMVRNKAGTKAENAVARLRVTYTNTDGRVTSPAAKLVTTAGSTITNIFNPFTGAISASTFNQVRFSLLISENTGATNLTVAYQKSYDGETWGPLVAIGSEFTTNGYHYGTTFSALVVADAPFVRWGIRSRNVSGTVVESVLVSMKIDMRRV